METAFYNRDQESAREGPAGSTTTQWSPVLAVGETITLRFAAALQYLCRVKAAR